MHEREQGMITGLVILLLVLTLGFYVHRDARFPGSLRRHAGALRHGTHAHPARLPLRQAPPMAQAGCHTGRVHALPPGDPYVCRCAVRSWVSSTVDIVQQPAGHLTDRHDLVVVLSGFVGRYLMKMMTTDMRQQQQLLAGLRGAYDRVAAELAQDAGQTAALRPFAGFLGRLVAVFFVDAAALPPSPSRQYLAFVFSYLYLWTVAPQGWSSVALPASGWPIAAAASLAVAAASGYAASRLLRQSRLLCALALLVALGSLSASLWLEIAGHWHSGLRPEAAGYAALVYLGSALQLQIVAALVIMGLDLLARLTAGRADNARRVTFDCLALLIYYAAGQGLLGLLLVHGFPRAVA